MHQLAKKCRKACRAYFGSPFFFTRELQAKVVQTLLGHSSIVMTLDIYGHLFRDGSDRAELAASEKALFG
jgi:integrase